MLGSDLMIATRIGETFGINSKDQAVYTRRDFHYLPWPVCASSHNSQYIFNQRKRGAL